MEKHNISTIHFEGVLSAIDNVNKTIIISAVSIHGKKIYPIFVEASVHGISCHMKLGDFVSGYGVVNKLIEGFLVIDIISIHFFALDNRKCKTFYKIKSIKYKNNIYDYLIKKLSGTKYRIIINNDKYNNIEQFIEKVYRENRISSAVMELVGIVISTRYDYHAKNYKALLLLARNASERLSLPIFANISGSNKHFPIGSMVSLSVSITTVIDDDYFSYLFCTSKTNFRVIDYIYNNAMLEEDYYNCLAAPDDIIKTRIDRRLKFKSYISNNNYYTKLITDGNIRKCIHGWWSGWGYWDSWLSTNIDNIHILLSFFHDSFPVRIIVIKGNRRWSKINAFSIIVAEKPVIFDGDVFIDNANLNILYSWIVKNKDMLLKEGFDECQLPEIEFIDTF